MVTATLSPDGASFSRARSSTHNVKYTPSPNNRLPVLLVSGIFGSGFIWEPIENMLIEENFGVIVQEDPLAAISGKIDDMVEAVVEILDDLNIHRAHVVGNSLGGLVTLLAAERYPDRVVSVVASGVPGFKDKIDLGIPLPLHPSYEFACNLTSRIFPDATVISPAMIARCLADISPPDTYMNMLRSLRTARDYDISPVLPAINQDILLVFGEQDVITPVTNWANNLALLRHGRLECIPMAGHSPQIDRPAEFGALLLDFLRRQV